MYLGRSSFNLLLWVMDSINQLWGHLNCHRSAFNSYWFKLVHSSYLFRSTKLIFSFIFLHFVISNAWLGSSIENLFKHQICKNSDRNCYLYLLSHVNRYYSTLQAHSIAHVPYHRNRIKEEHWVSAEKEDNFQIQVRSQIKTSWEIQFLFWYSFWWFSIWK